RVPLESLRAASTSTSAVPAAVTRPPSVAAVAPEHVPDWVLERLGFLAGEGRRRDAEALIDRLGVRSETRAELRRSFEQALTAVEADRDRRARTNWCNGTKLELGAAPKAPPSVVSFRVGLALTSHSAR
ncbi:MAG: hypothetical protein KIT58_02655, partial [Planctomycetota bacterium]|nr:hypothetical protein [Planctomycetota bacterium]